MVRVNSILTGFVAVAVSGSAFAEFTTIQDNAGEASHLDIFNAVYGGGFTADGLNFTNGTLTAVRLDDAADQSFALSSFNAKAIAKFASLDQSFGYLNADGDYVNLFEESGEGFAASGSVEGVSLDSPIVFAREGVNGVVSSDVSSNPDLRDHLVTYRLDGMPGEVYVLAFEDLFGGPEDDDFQDLVIEVSSINVVPSPAAMGGGLMLLGGLVARRRRA